MPRKINFKALFEYMIKGPKVEGDPRTVGAHLDKKLDALDERITRLEQTRRTK